MPDVQLRPASTADRAYIEDLLAANDLPVADVPDLIGEFTVFEVDGDPIGTAALLQYQGGALLRSVVIEADLRGRGYGRTCCRRLVDDAAEDGFERVYLLTTTAPEFFASLGFEVVDREAVPDTIKETRLFAELCPTSATVMAYQIDAESGT